MAGTVGDPVQPRGCVAERRKPIARGNVTVDGMATTKKTVKGSAKSGPAKMDASAQRAAMYEKTLQSIATDSIVKGRVIKVNPNEVLVDIGYKSEGTVSKDEFKDITAIQPGDEFEVLILDLENEDGMCTLSKVRAEKRRRWENVVLNCTEGSIVTGEIKGRVKGGMIVDIGVDAFLPGSQTDMSPSRNVDDLIGQSLEFKIIKIHKERQNVVLSRRELLDDRRKEGKERLLKELKNGQTRRGMVKNLTEFGAFVDLGGMDGLLHITDMSWGRLSHPSEAVAVGQELEVVILDVDVAKERISLGLKQLTNNPWQGVEDRFPVGSRIRGRVTNLATYGAFIELEQGIEGLVHVSELSWTKRIAKASDVLKVGDIVEAVVLGVNPQEQRISLGIRQTEANPWEAVPDRYPIGSRVKGHVRNFTNFGAFVELEAGVDGMIHVSDMSWTRKVNHPSEVLKKGEEVECVVLDINPNEQRISLGMKQALEDPWASMAAKYHIGQLVKGKVSKVASFGAFVALEEGVDGLVHISQISDERVQRVRDVLQPGQEVEARVIKIDTAERKIGLSVKAAKVSEENFVVSDDMLQGLRPGEDLVDLAGAFDEAFSNAAPAPTEDWRPGESK